jgi:hypothetical protein
MARVTIDGCTFLATPIREYTFSFVSVKLTASSRGDRSGSSRARLTIAVSILSGIFLVGSD